MSSIAHATDVARRMTGKLVADEERRTGSRMLAYERAAAAIDASASWLQKFTRRSPEVALSFARGLNIRAAYDRLCDRLAAEQEAERAEAKRLRMEWNEIALGILGMVDGTAAPSEVRAGSEADRSRSNSQTSAAPSVLK